MSSQVRLLPPPKVGHLQPIYIYINNQIRLQSWKASVVWPDKFGQAKHLEDTNISSISIQDSELFMTEISNVPTNIRTRTSTSTSIFSAYIYISVHSDEIVENQLFLHYQQSALSSTTCGTVHSKLQEKAVQSLGTTPDYPQEELLIPLSPRLAKGSGEYLEPPPSPSVV